MLYYPNNPLNELCDLMLACEENEALKWCQTGPLNKLQDALKHMRANWAVLLERACLHGQLDIAKWLFAQMNDPLASAPFSTALFSAVCSRGHLGIAQWMFAIHPWCLTYDAFVHACHHNQLKVAQWLIQTDGHISSDCFYRAFEKAWANKHAHVTLWLYQQRPFMFTVPCTVPFGGEEAEEECGSNQHP